MPRTTPPMLPPELRLCKRGVVGLRAVARSAKKDLARTSSALRDLKPQDRDPPCLGFKRV